MLGAIVGDVVGSVYEWNNIKTKAFPLFRCDCFFTDDTIMTCAVAEAIMQGGEKDDFIDSMKKLGRMYPTADYGGRFGAWLMSDDKEPYNSWGNGAAMRVSPCGWVSNCRELAIQSAAVTHSHPEGIKGALAVTDSILIGRNAMSVDDAKKQIEECVENEYGYDLTRKMDEIRPGYKFDESCQGTVPEAIIAFLESEGFEDAIRNAISLGGDSDTLAAITGSIAEAVYGIPQDIREKVWSYLDESLRDVCIRWGKFVE